MRSSVKAIAKELSIHIVIILSCLGLGCWYLSSREVSRRPVAIPNNRVYTSDTLRIEPWEISCPKTGYVVEKWSGNVMLSHRSTTGAKFTLEKKGTKVWLVSLYNGQRSEYEIPNLEAYQGDRDKLRLACDGMFVEYKGVITYTCYHLPLVYVFDNRGRPLGRINTIDRVPYPELRKYAGCVTLEQGRAHNSSQASFVRDGVVYVLSERVDPRISNVILDCYSLSDHTYLHSVRARGDKPLGNHDVSSIEVVRGTLVLVTSRGLY